jgi:16S rRNA (cytosine1402-N4)-methyltransferase
MHEPVLLQKVLDTLLVNNQALFKDKRLKFIDATLGAGGHSAQLLRNGWSILGIEADEYMIPIASRRLQEACPGPITDRTPFVIVHDNFVHIKKIALEYGFMGANAILFDLGISSIHYEQKQRGFSFADPEMPLDMRLDNGSQQVKASDLLNSLRYDQLLELFQVVLNYQEAKKLVDNIIVARQTKSIEKVADFLVLLPRKPKGKVHPATKAFLALRIAVNSEMDNIQIGIEDGFSVLAPNGKMIVITFHSAEDRLVKSLFKNLVEQNKARFVTHKPIAPSLEEIYANPKARSAKLRSIEKI